MIDRKCRDEAVSAVRRFLGCETDNIDFENEYPEKTPDDPAIRVLSDFFWNLYDDFHSHKLDGEHTLSDEGRAICERCIIFLNSDAEYEWHETRLMFPTRASSGEIIVLDLSGAETPRTLAEYLQTYLDQPEGDASVWPFFRRSDYESALAL